MTETNNPLAVQVGGGHYKDLAIQPIEFSMLNRLDGCAHSILKYITRHRDKAGVVDIGKARHFLALHLHLADPDHLVHRWVIRMSDYCHANSLPLTETRALLLLAEYLTTGSAEAAARVDEVLKELQDSYAEAEACA